MVAGLGISVNEEKAMGILQVELPPEVEVAEAQLILMMRLYEMGRLTLGQAARLSGYSKGSFMELLGKYNVPTFNYLADELDQEMNL
jgi:predicted HTH domain antitoxin